MRYPDESLGGNEFDSDVAGERDSQLLFAFSGTDALLHEPIPVVESRHILGNNRAGHGRKSSR